ncbi:hypothetical protein [Cellulophaga lytica]|nr:hypothetical protein [Cellulophaga lytica]WQG76704.1 hypothetical protein SR888_13515 [Cellulophaga lytica]
MEIVCLFPFASVATQKSPEASIVLISETLNSCIPFAFFITNLVL